MSDIVERLRQSAAPSSTTVVALWPDDLLNEAADEIERQAAEIAMLKSDEKHATELAEKYLSQSNEAQAEIERLRLLNAHWGEKVLGLEREIERLRHDLELYRQTNPTGIDPFGRPLKLQNQPDK